MESFFKAIYCTVSTRTYRKVTWYQRRYGDSESLALFRIFRKKYLKFSKADIICAIIVDFHDAVLMF